MGQSNLDDTFYGRCAGLYDRFASASIIRGWRQRAVETLELSGGETVVEMGCGTGSNFPFLREAVGPDGQVIGVDLVEAMLQRARGRIDRAGWENVHVVRGDATRPPLDQADAILSTFVIGMLEEPDEAVRQWIQGTRPGGRVTLMNAERSPHWFASPINLACRAFVRATAPGFRFQRVSPVKQLENRWQAATDSLFEGSVEHVDERLGIGLVTLASGTVPDPHGYE